MTAEELIIFADAIKNIALEHTPEFIELLKTCEVLKIDHSNLVWIKGEAVVVPAKSGYRAVLLDFFHYVYVKNNTETWNNENVLHLNIESVKDYPSKYCCIGNGEIKLTVLTVPSIGTKVYVPTTSSLNGGKEVSTGGLATINKIEYSDHLPKDHDCYIMVGFEGLEQPLINWKYLLENQAKWSKGYSGGLE